MGRPRPETSLRTALARAVPAERILDRPIDLVAHASDASFYRLVPRAVIRAASIDEVMALFRASRELGMPLTFRAAGTSLSGQAVTDGILIDVARHWRRLQVLEDGKAIRVQPGVIGADANRALRPFGAKLGPDPASLSACTLGGILSNNSSGMCCLVAQNAYHTLRSLTAVLPSGTIVETADPRADERLREAEPALAEGLLALRRELLANGELTARIRAKYRTKNTTGYSLNAFLDFDRPAEILAHLLVGSEGTLAFIAEAVLETVPDLPVRYTGLLLFADLHAACAAIPSLNAAGAKALELMDRAALRSVETQPGTPPTLRELREGAAGLLAEFQGRTEAERGDLERRAQEAVRPLALLQPARFTHDPEEQAALWKVRSGMFPSVGAVRKSGTTVIIEDVAFPVARLADAAVDLTLLFAKHGYQDAIVFGHAREGNLHFVLTQSFNTQAEVDRYARLMEDVVSLVVSGYDGALKAEHGTGRNMAPFVEAEWGPAALDVMRRLKALFDEKNLLNPGVILNADPRAHLKDLKPLPAVEEEVDKCIECGFCEPRCPSRELTLTPRQRIAVRRELAYLPRGRSGVRRSLEADFPYEAIDTCAVDGLCATACPVGIDTGRLAKRLRKARHPAWAHALARTAAERFALLEPAVRMALAAGHVAQRLLGGGGMEGLGRAARWALRRRVPLFTREMPRPAGRRPATVRAGARAIYLPSCLSRVMGPVPGERSEMSVMHALVTVAERAGLPVHIPRDVEGTCCGVPFSSKGYDEAHALAAGRAVERLWAWTEEGRLPVVVDTSPCTAGLLTCRPHLSPEGQRHLDALTIQDALTFVARELLPRLTVTRRLSRVAIHPVCSVVKMGLEGQLTAIAQACAVEVVLPPSAGCCGFAGDRGFLYPELTASATSAEAAELSGLRLDGCFSSSRTCEVGLTRATGQAWSSYLHLVERSTRA